MKFLKFITLAFFVIFQISCKKGEKNATPVPEPIQVFSLSVEDYSSAQINIHVTGEIQIKGVVNLDILDFYENKQCTGTSIGSVAVKDFNLYGVDLTMNNNNPKKLYVTTMNSDDCLFFMDYEPVELKPSVPKFSKTSPESPTRENASPGIFGTAFPSSATIFFFSDVNCQTAVGNGSVIEFEGNGIQIILTENQTTEIYAYVEDLLAQKSNCTHLTSYTHLDTVITNPVFTASVPISPNNTSSTPLIQGLTSDDAIQITIYNDASCSNALITGTPETFESPGLQVILNNNSTTNLYAKSIDDNNNPSACSFLTTYVHDTLPPEPPTYVSINPISPNNSILNPKLKGTASADTLTVKFYVSPLCLTQIGAGTKAAFEGVGIPVGVDENTTTQIYAQNYDPSGNASTCTYMTQYKHNTIPPDFPIYSGTTPSSPNNNNTNPSIFGTALQYTNALSFYSDENCTALVGSGTPAQYEGSGIPLALQANNNNSIYVQVSDIEGNVSNCGFHASYEHSNIPAPNVGLLYSFPATPTNGSNMPFIVGTAHSSIVTVELYDDNTCANSLGSGSKGQFTSAGIQITLPSNSTTDIHAIATDIYGNVSSCGFLMTFIHNTIPPNNPVFSATSPLSPNAISTSPLILGSSSAPVTSQLPVSKIMIYDNSFCTNKVGEGTPVEFSGAGIIANVSADNVTALYAKAFDDANNGSMCTLMTNYTHDSYKPGKPIFTSSTPTTPSFTKNVKIKGVFGASSDFLNRTSVGIYTDSSCSSLLTSGSPIDYENAGIDVVLPSNVTTSLYAATINEVSTFSDCQFQINFKHHDLPPQSLTVSNNFDGSVYLTWLPDLVSSPLPTYTVERSLSASGPFTIVGSSLNANNLTDDLVNEGETYYYRVLATNSTGRSQNSTVESITISAGAPANTNSLTAIPGDSEVRLSWSSNINNMTYKVYRSTTSGGPFVSLGVETSTTIYVDNTVNNNQSYYYIVKGINPSGQSMESNMASAYPRPLPAAPSNLVIQGYPSHKDCSYNQGLQLSWSPTNYYTEFGILRGSNGGARILNQTTSQLSHVYCGWNMDSNHSLSVIAQWGSDSSDESNVVYYRWTNPPILDLDPGDSEIVLKWNQPDGGNLYSGTNPLYDIYRATDINGPYTKIVSDEASLSYTDNTVSQGTTYYYYIQTHVQTVSPSHYYLVGPHSEVRSGTPSIISNDPTNLTVKVNSLETVELHWTAPTHFNSFNLYHATNVGGPYTLVGNYPSNIVPSAFLIEGLNHFYVKGVWGNQETSATNIVSFRKATISGFSLSASTTDITLNWNLVTGANGYKVFRATEYNGVYSEIGNPAINSYIDSTAANGVGYYYKVQATFADSTLGQLTTYKSAKLNDGTTTPSGVSLEIVSGTSIKVKWTPIPTATQHLVYSATSAGGPYTQKAVLPGAGAETTVSGFSANTQYFIKVGAIVSATEYLTTPKSIYTYSNPGAPIVTVGNNQLNVSWTPVSGALTYDLLRSSDGKNFSSVVTSHPTSSYLDTGTVNGQIYFYKVQANFASGSTLSSSTSGATPGITPLAPTQVFVRNNNTGTELVLDWSKVEGVNTYKVYVDTTPSHVTPVQTSSSNQDVVIAGLNLGTTYYIAVSATNGDMESALTPDAIIVTDLESAAPTVEWGSASSIDVSWSAVTNAVTYNVYRSTDSYDFNLLASGIASTTYNDATIDPNTTYYYYYKSFDASGRAMADSAISSGINIGFLPLAPQSLHLSAEDNSSVNLSWISTPLANTYRILRGTSSGGPYSQIASVTAPTIQYTDNTVVSGNTYFYVVQTVTLEKVASAYSNEVGINLNGGPASLLASNAASGVQLNWNSLAGASSYNVARSENSGGPYGVITNVGTNSYIDTSAVADVSYYYVVTGVYADNSISPVSNEANINRSGSLKLQVPIELTDTRLASSDLTDVTFQRTMTSLNTDDYDGVTSYEFEVIAKNSDSSSHNIYLVDEGNVEIASILLPANTTDYTRLRTSFAPNIGSDKYRIKISTSTFAAQVEVNSAKILVNQSNASKTKLYFPLLSVSQIPSANDGEVFAHSTMALDFSSPNSRIQFLRQANDLENLTDFNAWELEAIVSTTGTAEGVVALNNNDVGQLVYGTYTRFSNNALTLANIPIDEGVANFNSSNEGHLYEIQIMCEYNCSSGTVALHKAGLWVKLENLTKAISYYRMAGLQDPQGSSTDYYDDRIYLDLSLYSNPLLYFEADLEDDITSSADVSLVYHANDSGSFGLNAEVSSMLSFNSDLRERQRTGALTLISGQRFSTRLEPSGGMVNLNSSALIIKSSLP